MGAPNQQSSRLTLLEPCAPYKLTKYTIVEGEIKKTEMKINGYQAETDHAKIIPIVLVRSSSANPNRNRRDLSLDSQLAICS